MDFGSSGPGSSQDRKSLCCVLRQDFQSTSIHSGGYKSVATCWDTLKKLWEGEEEGEETRNGSAFNILSKTETDVKGSPTTYMLQEKLQINHNFGETG